MPGEAGGTPGRSGTSEQGFRRCVLFGSGSASSCRDISGLMENFLGPRHDLSAGKPQRCGRGARGSAAGPAGEDRGRGMLPAMRGKPPPIRSPLHPIDPHIAPQRWLMGWLTGGVGEQGKVLLIITCTISH